MTGAGTTSESASMRGSRSPRWTIRTWPTPDSKIGLALRDFIVQFDTQHLPEAVQDLVGRYLRLISVEDRGQTHIPHPVDVFVIDG